MTVIGIDHGYGYMKTANTVFLTGITEFEVEPPFQHKMLKYNGKYYVVGDTRLGYQALKTENENYYLLTLTCIAEEIRTVGRHKDEITLAVGLPLEYIGAQKDDFKRYLMRNGKDIKFQYEGENYNIKVSDVYIFPQAYAIIAKDIASYVGTKIVVDIGSWTIDIIPITNKMPKQSACESLPLGVITCIERIQKEFRRIFNAEVEDVQIQEVLMGKEVLPNKYLKVAEKVIREYAQEIVIALKQKKFNLDVTPVVYCGGGATVMKLFGTYDKDMTAFIEDINANAKGYEYLCKGIMRKKTSEKGQ